MTCVEGRVGGEGVTIHYAFHAGPGRGGGAVRASLPVGESQSLILEKKKEHIVTPTYTKHTKTSPNLPNRPPAYTKHNKTSPNLPNGKIRICDGY